MYKCLFIILFGFFALNVNSQLTVNFKADTNYVCINTPLAFHDLSYGDTITSRMWDFGNNTTSTDENPIISYDTAGIYSVKLIVNTASTSDSITKTDYIIVRELPDANFTFSLHNDIFINDTFALSTFAYYFVGNHTKNDSLKYTYSWDFVNNYYSDTTDTIEYMFSSAGDFDVKFIVEAGYQCTDTATNTVTVTDLVEVPNIFTPNNDGVNDILLFRTNGKYTFDLTIYSRWGTIVYIQSAKKIMWDGRSAAGLEVEAGTYFYHITSPDISGYEKSGYFFINR